MYTHFFAYGFLFAFEAVFKGYPVPNEWVALFEAAAKSAKLDPEKIRYVRACLGLARRGWGCGVVELWSCGAAVGA